MQLRTILWYPSAATIDCRDPDVRLVWWIEAVLDGGKRGIYSSVLALAGSHSRWRGLGSLWSISGWWQLMTTVIFIVNSVVTGRVCSGLWVREQVMMHCMIEEPEGGRKNLTIQKWITREGLDTNDLNVPTYFRPTNPPFSFHNGQHSKVGSKGSGKLCLQARFSLKKMHPKQHESVSSSTSRNIGYRRLKIQRRNRTYKYVDEEGQRKEGSSNTSHMLDVGIKFRITCRNQAHAERGKEVQI
jgi:hypothetical protein